MAAEAFDLLGAGASRSKAQKPKDQALRRPSAA
jgi:hypothetical protein